jgi:hypothetical protein
MWDFLRRAFEARVNPEAAQHRKRIAGFQPMKTEIAPNRTYLWCSCGHTQHQVTCRTELSFHLRTNSSLSLSI